MGSISSSAIASAISEVTTTTTGTIDAYHRLEDDNETMEIQEGSEHSQQPPQYGTGDGVINIDDAIEAIGMGKFQRRVLWAAGV